MTANRKLRLSAALLAVAFGLTQHAVAQLDAVNLGPPDRSLSRQAEDRAVVSDGSSGTQDRLMLPVNTIAGLELRSIVNSRTAHPGQMIYCTTTYPIAAGNRVAVPAGSFVRGRITRVSVPKRFKGHAEIAMHFDQIVLPNGTTSPMDADLVGISGTGPEAFSEHAEAIVGHGSKAKDLAGGLKSAAGWSTVGSLIAVNTGGSALAGGVVGGVGGVVRFADVLLSRADAIVLTPGTNLDSAHYVAEEQPARLAALISTYASE